MRESEYVSLVTRITDETSSAVTNVHHALKERQALLAQKALRSRQRQNLCKLLSRFVNTCVFLWAYIYVFCICLSLCVISHRSMENQSGTESTVLNAASLLTQTPVEVCVILLLYAFTVLRHLCGQTEDQAEAG